MLLPDDPHEVFELRNVICIKETDAALLVEINLSSQVWIPKSQLSQHSHVRSEGDYGTLIVTRWIAIQKGWTRKGGRKRVCDSSM